MNKRFIKKAEKIPSLFVALTNDEPMITKGSVSQKGKTGVYAFFKTRRKNGRAVHVGRTRNLQGRLRGHITLSHYSASFAFKLARRALNFPRGTRAELMGDKKFMREFKRQIARVKKMYVRFVEVPDAATQYLLELYAFIEWKLPLDEFDTH